MNIVYLLFSIPILIILFIHNPVVAEIKASVKKVIIKNTQDNNSEYVRKRFLQLMKKPFIDEDKNKKQQKKILIIGDSHAQDLLNAIVENNYLALTQIRTRYIPTRCQIYLGEDNNEKWLNTDKQLCEKSDSLELAKKQINDADVIILAAFWRKWAAELLSKTIKNINLRSDQSIFIIGRRSFRKVDSNRLHNLNQSELKQLRNAVDENQLDINTIMQNTLDKKIFVDVHTLICVDVATCPAFTDNAKLISFDGGHLSQDGARYIGRELFQKSQLKQLITE